MTNIVAEIGCNHQGKPEIAKRLIDAAAECGVNWIKLQKRNIVERGDWDKEYNSIHSFGKTYYEHRKALELVDVAWWELKDYAERRGLGFFATPFDVESISFLKGLGVQYIKVPSPLNNNTGFLEVVKNSEIKSIFSTGMLTLKDIESSVGVLSPHVVMQTTTCYPCPVEQVNLNVLVKLSKAFKGQIGLSGHYVSGNGAIEAAAVALGATWIERHFTLDRTWKGTDHSASLEPAGLKTVVKAIRTVERALGTGKKRIMPCEKASVTKYRK